MTPHERAEKIVEKWNEPGPTKQLIKFIAAQLEEVEREAVEVPKINEEMHRKNAEKWEALYHQQFERAEAYKNGRLDAQYDNDTLPEQIEAYKRKAYAEGFLAATEQANKEKGLEWSQGFEFAREKAKGIAENVKVEPMDEGNDPCYCVTYEFTPSMIAQRIEEMEP